MAKIGSNPQSAPGDVFFISPTSQATVGSRFDSADGRVYRYAQFGTSAVVAGNLLAGVATVANHQHLTVATGATAGMGSLGQNPSIVVTLGATSGSAGFYSNGYLVVDSGSGHLGQTYSIVSNTTAASSGTMTIVLGEPLQTAITAGSDTVGLVPNPYNAVLQYPTVPTGGNPVGVAVMAGTAGWYGYVQTRGPAAVLSDASVGLIGTAVIPSVTTAGCVTVGTTGGTGIFLGSTMVAAVSARTNAVFLDIE